MTGTRTLLCGVVLVGVTAAITAATTQQDDDAWAKYSTPGAEHDVLDKLWGTWHFAVAIEGADGEVDAQSLDADYRWELGGRFLIGRYDGYINGQLFQAREILGYDRFRGEYRSVWLDNNTTAIITLTGEYDASKRTLTLKGVQDDVEKGLRDQPFMLIYRFGDADHFTVEVWRPDAAGQMVKGTSVAATRQGTESD